MVAVNGEFCVPATPFLHASIARQGCDPDPGYPVLFVVPSTQSLIGIVEAFLLPVCPAVKGF